MAKTKKSTKGRDALPKLPSKAAPTTTDAPVVQSHAVRETVESIVIAFVLAFLFRTFEAEAFVIPTGSMAPTLMGRHKDVECAKCGQRFRVSASEEEPDANEPAQMPWGGGPSSGDGSHREIVAGECPNCRYVMPMTPNLPRQVLGSRSSEDVESQTSYNGDRILVNKYIYAFAQPRRWDIVVFKYPGDAQMNYIKRLVGLPNETVRIFQGDLFVGPEEASDQGDFEIARKPPDKVLAMRQLVHDTNYEPGELIDAGWPLRWGAVDSIPSDGWKIESSGAGKDVVPRMVFEGDGAEPAWLRYRHFVPNDAIWQAVDAARRRGTPSDSALLREQLASAARPNLVMDFNAYNTGVQRWQAEQRMRAGQRHALEADGSKLGIHWVGDLMVEADVEVEAAKGELLLDLVEAGKHFTCRIDLATGQATLKAEGDDDFAPVAQTPLSKAGTFHVALANFDDQLLLWVDDKLIPFDASTTYDANLVFGSRQQIVPRTSETDPGDLAPVGIGARGAKLAITRVQVWRDIYYIASSHRTLRPSEPVHDFERPSAVDFARLPFDPQTWDAFDERRHVDFPLGDDQFFVMGDNSAASSDARLWAGGSGRGRPGGDYLERRLLIGKALSVYWPHSWNRIPGTPIPFPLFPNVEDMRLVE